MNPKSQIALCFSILLLSISAKADVDFKKAFGERDGCFILSELESGKTIAEFNSQRCARRLSPCSTFKIAAAVMGFDKGVLKDENQIIKWDGIKRDRKELDQNQTPYTWMSHSAKWVTEWLMPQFGKKEIQRYLDAFDYGNRDFSGGLKDAWVTSSLEISANEQVAFLSKLWKSKLSASERSQKLTRKIIFIEKLDNGFDLYGKTGSGCLQGHACMDRPGKMLGWFVGAIEKKSKIYIFAANASDLLDQRPPGGPRVRTTTVDILNQLKL